LVVGPEPHRFGGAAMLCSPGSGVIIFLMFQIIYYRTCIKNCINLMWTLVRFTHFRLRCSRVGARAVAVSKFYPQSEPHKNDAAARCKGSGSRFSFERIMFLDLDPVPFKKCFELRVYCKMAKSSRKQAERYFYNYLQETLILTFICFDFLKKIYTVVIVNYFLPEKLIYTVFEKRQNCFYKFFWQFWPEILEIIWQQWSKPRFCDTEKCFFLNFVKVSNFFKNALAD
jgi:hypothetical protein